MLGDLHSIDLDALPRSCGCPDHELTLWQIEAVEHAITRALRGETRCKAEIGEAGGDEWLEYELEVATALAEAQGVKGEKARKLIEDALDSGSSIEEAVEEAEREMADTFSLAEAAVVAALAGALATGEGLILSGSLADRPMRDQVLAGMVASTKYYTNTHFNTYVVPALFREVDKVLSGKAPFEQPDWTPVREALQDRLKSVPYWRLVATTAASRSFHYGYMKAAQVQGFRGYRFVAILDERTTDICQDMDGREFLIADAVSLLERVAQSDDPEEAKKLTPWTTAEQIKGKSNQELVKDGTFFPPLHGYCRSTVEPF